MSDAGLWTFLLLRRQGALDDHLIERYLQTSAASEATTAVIFNKTERDVESWIDRIGAKPATTLVIDRPRDEAIYKTMGQLTVPPSGWVVQFHDDDDWEGTIQVPGKQHVSAFLASIDRRQPQRDTSTQNTLFGAIRGDVWNCFSSYCADSPVTQDSLDYSLQMLVGTYLETSWLDNYFYLYDRGSWNTPKKIDDSNEIVAGRTGWGEFSRTQAVHMHMFLDMFALAHYASGRLDSFSLERALGKIWERRPNRVFGRYQSDSTNWVPGFARRSIVESRSYSLEERAISLVKSPFRRDGRSPQNRLQQLLTGKLYPKSYSDITASVIPIIHQALPELRDQCDFWQACIQSAIPAQQNR